MIDDLSPEKEEINDWLKTDTRTHRKSSQEEHGDTL